jgi:hypothetical protein
MRTLDPSPRDRHALADLDAVALSVLSRHDLAAHIGMGEDTISRWWSGERAMPVAALLAVGRRVVAGSVAAGARYVDAIGHAIGLRGRWLADVDASVSADVATIASLARAAAAAADILEDGAISADEVVAAVALVERLERETARLRASISRAR